MKEPWKFRGKAESQGEAKDRKFNQRKKSSESTSENKGMVRWEADESVDWKSLQEDLNARKSD